MSIGGCIWQGQPSLSLSFPKVESWGRTQALHYVHPISLALSLSPPHLCGNHFQFVSLLSVPGLSPEDPAFMIDVVAMAILLSGGRGRPHSFAVFKTSNCHFQSGCYSYRIVLAFADCVCLFFSERMKNNKRPTDLNHVLFVFTWVLACPNASDLLLTHGISSESFFVVSRCCWCSCLRP